MLVENVYLFYKKMSWLRNTITSLYKTVTTPASSTRDALAEKVQSLRGAAYLLYEISGKCSSPPLPPPPQKKKKKKLYKPKQNSFILEQRPI